MKCRKGGFTLLELILVVAILGIGMGIFASVLVNGVKSYILVVSRRSVLSEGRMALSRMVSEMMLIPSPSQIDYFGESSIQFDIPSENNIRYYIMNGSLMRRGTEIAENVSSLRFQYLNKNGVPTSIKSEIRRIVIELTLRAAGEQGNIVLRTAVFPRNFGRNYNEFE